ncbi:DUF2855 family protein [Algiphilus sp. NNCM1]|uniref:DUF2855 family protein n=1 Tax=Algiphilus sp. TaxID=1872431 RepID=UPI001CA74981|nr:DUF2855 family protein [Algiphilus sp.]MBY8964737.1 DUF2855 family protein [Algiphilus acroporae]MCI5104401.1 DUF2855 family protein [Algiphilus sp.]
MALQRTQRLLVHKKALQQQRVDTQSAPRAPDEGEALLAPALFSLTTNNVTYAAYGEAMRYWDFFPSGDDDWGLVPVWGFATVVASQVDGVDVGERFYGYWPPATVLRVQPDKISAHGFRDATRHRRALPPVYNQYFRCAQDPLYTPETEAFQALYRPLFMTGFSLADFIGDREAFGARRVLFSSASSKTAYGTAFCMDEAVETVGLTSARNLDFVAGSGCYHRTVDYAALRDLAPDVPTLYVDLSGNRDLRAAVHGHFQALRHSCVVGSAHSVEPPSQQALPGPPPTFFFAPDQIAKRMAEWGAEGFGQRLGVAWARFHAHVCHPPRNLLQVMTGEGLEEARTVFAQLLAGEVAPREGHVIQL